MNQRPPVFWLIAAIGAVFLLCYGVAVVESAWHGTRYKNFGYGIERRKDGVFVSRTIPGHPASRLLKPGDRILAVNGDGHSEGWLLDRVVLMTPAGGTSGRRAQPVSLGSANPRARGKGSIVVGHSGASRLRTKAGVTTLGTVFWALSGAPASTEVELVDGGLVSYVNGRGDLGRAPFLCDTDARLSHEFGLWRESTKLRVDWNVVNVFNQATATNIYARYNHPNDGPLTFPSLAHTMREFDYRAMLQPQHIRVDPQYGQPNAFLSPRDMQFGLHFVF